jgi:trigger factor
MKTEVKKIDSTKREINIEVSGEIIKNKFEDVFKRIAKEAKVPGFRPGNAPGDILEKHFASNAHEQVLKELVPDLYNEAIKKEELDVIELPEVTDVKLDRNSLSFKATVEVSPQINIKNYKGQKVNYKNISVSPDEVKRNIDSLKQARSIDRIDDSFARGLGYPNSVELEKAIERQILLNKENQERSRIENELIENLTQDLDFKIPQSLVKRQLQHLVRQAKLELALRGVAGEQIDEQEEVLFKELQAPATKQVKVYLVLAEIAKRENIPQDDSMPARVMEFLLKEANWVKVS